MPKSDKNNQFGTIDNSNQGELSSKTKNEQPLQAELASLTQRLVGAMIDNFIFSTLLIPFMIKMDLFRSIQTIHTQVIIFLFWFLYIVLINGYFLYTRGQTIGKIAAGTQIADLNGKILTLEGVIFLRYLPLQLISQIPIIGQGIAIFDIVMIFNPDRRCLHDHIAKTVVVTYLKERNRDNEQTTG
ncbi:MAG: RDD family protein [Deltaproteobacteria bacterium]|nr:RDD family protein [Deltaproteobacteria bacterium]